MKYTRIREIFRDPAAFMNKTVQLGGWVRSVRDSKNFGFIQLNDGSFFKPLQVVADGGLPNFTEVMKLGVGSSCTVTGKIIESQGDKQPFELKAETLTIEGTSPADYPLQKKRHSNEYLRTIAHLRPRTNTFAAVFRVRSLAAFAIHKFFNERGFVYVHTPIITGSDCEGAGEMFQVTAFDLGNVPKKDGTVDFHEDYFGKMASLTVSGQLSAETFALALRDVYTFGPTFRAENSNTTRHTAEFWMIEPEIAFADLNDDMDLAEDMLKYIIRYVLEQAPEEMAFFNEFVDKGLIERLANVANSDFARITYTEALELIAKSGQKFEYPARWGMAIQTEHERFLAETVFQKPVFVTDYPREVKPFYTRLNDDGKTVACTDLMAPGLGEIIGASQREERLEVLQEAISRLGLRQEDYWWYLELRKYGSVKHAGFGLGFERCLMYLTGMQNIRDVIPYPRTPNNLEF